MVGSLSFLSIFLIGLTRAQCPTECSQCKVFNDGEMCGPTGDQFNCGGTWNLLEPNPNPRCTQIIDDEKVNVCLYRREGDGKQFCFCDPGDLEYEICSTNPEMCWTDCYNFTGVEVKWYPLPHNDAASCSNFCLHKHNITPYTFFVLLDTNCGCLTTAPPPGWKVEDSHCYLNCTTGRTKTKCGGWKTFYNGGPITPVIPIDEACPCYNNTDPIYSSKPYLLINNDKQACNDYCKLNHPNFTHFELGSSKENKGYKCYCEYSAPPSKPVAQYYCCGSPCPGNKDEECGYNQNWNNQNYVNVCEKLP